MAEELTIVFGYRNRDTARVKRCLDSLEQQTFTSFRVIFVDYGSSQNVAQDAEGLINRYQFCDYIYSDTRGYPWNRSHALNTGGKLAETPFILTTDVDMIFPSDFLRIFMTCADQHIALYCAHQFLPQKFSDWENAESYVGKFKSATQNALGACQLISTDTFKQIRGFDEYYRYWGREDRDMYERLMSIGLQAVWMNDRTYMFHQWHPNMNYKTLGFMPEAMWGRMYAHYCRKKDNIMRNDEGWGQIVEPSNRQAFQFLDIERNRLNISERLYILDEEPDDNASLGKLVQRFWDMPSGHALGVNHAFFPKYNRGISEFLRYFNFGMNKIGASVRLQFGRNLLHSFLIEFIENNSDLIADYYLGFPALNGVSVLVRA